MSSQPLKPHSPLLSIKGLDHIRILVHDLEAAKDIYRDLLGFLVPPRGQKGIHPLGTENSVARFYDGFYLELLAIHDSATAAVRRPEMVRFLQHSEGGHSVLLNVASAQETADTLRARGFPVSAPIPGSIMRATESVPLPPGWWLVNFEYAPLPADLLSFIQYQRSWEERQADRSREPPHPNTATRGLAVWIAVPDAATAAQYFASLGLPSRRTLHVSHLGAMAHEVQVGDDQCLLLLQSLQQDSIVDHFLKECGSGGVMGVS